MTEQPVPPPNSSAKLKRTVVFSVVMVAVLGTFIWLSSLEGPPPMKRDAVHKDLTRDWQCLSCHTWPGPNAPAVIKPLPKSHPPPRPKKKLPVNADGSVDGPPEQFDCLKCHAPH